MPIVILDTYQNEYPFNYVLINNVKGASLATNYIISQRKFQPSYLRSLYPIGNFEERADGFYKAIRKNGFSSSKTIVHRLAPSIEGAYADMSAILESGEAIASAYFANNDRIAAGAMRAFKIHGYRIPKMSALSASTTPRCARFSILPFQPSMFPGKALQEQQSGGSSQ